MAKGERDEATVVLRPRFELEFLTEDNEYHVTYELTGSENSKERAMEESIISLTTKNAMEDDSAVFSFVLVGDTYWDRILSANDEVKLSIKPGSTKDATYNPVLLVGLISDVRLEGDYGANMKMYRITGQSMAKALMQFKVGVIRDVSLGLNEIGWLADDDIIESGGLPFTGNDAKTVVESILNRFTKYMKYNFRNGKTLKDFLVWGRDEARWNSWSDYEWLLDPSGFINFDGSVKQMLDLATGKPFNEMFVESTKDGKSEIVLRKTPFNQEDWQALTRHKITSSDVIKESIGKSDLEAYAVFHVIMATALGNLDSIGMGAFPRYHQSLVDKYGYNKLEVESIYLSGITDLDYIEEQLGGSNGGTGSSDGDYEGGTGTAIGGDVPEKVWNFFTSSGFSEEATAGIMGNAEKESGLNPSRHQDGGPAMGMFQWEGESGGTPYGRLANLHKYAKSKGKKWDDVQVQCEFLISEMAGGDSTTAYLLDQKVGGLSGFKKLRNVGRASDVFMTSFERPQDQTPGRRTEVSMKWYNKFKGTKPKESKTADKTTAKATPQTRAMAFGDVSNLVSMTPQRSLPENDDILKIYNVFRQYSNTELRLNKPKVVNELVSDTIASREEAEFFVDSMSRQRTVRVEDVAETATKTKVNGPSPKPEKTVDLANQHKEASYDEINGIGKNYRKIYDGLTTDDEKTYLESVFVDQLLSTYKGMSNKKATEIMRSYIDKGRMSKKTFADTMGAQDNEAVADDSVDSLNDGGDPTYMVMFTTMLYQWYCENPNFYSGEIVVVGHPTYRIGEVLEVLDKQNNDTWQFYIESVQHEYSYGEGYKTTLGVTRGLAHGGATRFTNLWDKSQEFKGGLMGEPGLEELNEKAREAREQSQEGTGDTGENNNFDSSKLTAKEGSAIATKAYQTALKYDKRNSKYDSIYVWGGGRQANMFKSQPIEGDCSSFVFECFNEAGFAFQGGRTSATTWSIKDDTRLKTIFDKGQKSTSMFEKMKKGDIVWFGDDDYHIGIYIGGGKFIGFQGNPTRDPNGGIKIEDLTTGYWWGAFNGCVKRV